MRLLLSILFISLSALASAGDRTITIHFVPQYNNQRVVFEEKYYPLSNADSIVFDVLRYYITNIRFYAGDKHIFSEKDSYHLIDHSAENTASIALVMPGEQFDNIRFNLGIDSITNTSGALTGDLDPIKGMYWAWQSGYINFKLEGRSSACPTRKHEFSFHLGGYLSPGYAMVGVNLYADGHDKYKDQDIYINLQLDKFIQAVDLQKQNSIMIPGKEAVLLSKKAAASFETK